MNSEIEIYSNDGQSLVVPEWTAQTIPSFEELCSAICTTHDAAQGAALKAINRMQTMRNWLIGYYIVEFEQKGKERAEYGTRLLKEITKRVDRKGINETLLQLSRLFYQIYPQMGQNLNCKKSATLSHKFINSMCATPSHESGAAEMDNQLFISTYQLQLPDKEQLRQFIQKQSILN